VRDPFSEDGRLYRTGDVAYVRGDGELVFLGRRDRQVKISGFRVELGEIEAAIGAHPDVRAAAVMVTGGSSPGLEAVYEVAERRVVEPETLRAHLAERLPAYMVPARLRPVPELPLTLNGKVDLERLSRATTREPGADGGYVAPRTPVEHDLAGLWSELLDVERVGVRDNFFDLGGHSLVATRLLSRVRARYDAEVTMRSFFEAPTIEDLARHLP
jgi:acyl carrier protein